MFNVISRPGCIRCDQSKALLQRYKISFKELIIDKDIPRNDVLTKHPNIKMLPIIEKESKYFGGYEELLLYINKEILPSAKLSLAS